MRIGGMVNLDDLLAAHTVLRGDLESRLTRIDESERSARLILDQCGQERRRVDAERQSLDDVEKMYRRRFVTDDDLVMPRALEPKIESGVGIVPAGPQRRARIAHAR